MARTRQQTEVPKPAPFDLASRFAAETATITIYDPADLGAKRDTGLRVEISSIYSDEARAAAAALQGAEGADWNTTLFEQSVAVTRKWWDVNGPADAIVIDGVEVRATPDAVRRVFSDPRTAWMQKQVQNGYLDLGRFFPKPKGS